MTENKSCVVASPKGCNNATHAQNNATIDATNTLPLSLKALASKVLKRNSQCNSPATPDKITRNYSVQTRASELQDDKSINVDAIIIKYNLDIQELVIAAHDDWHEIKNNFEILDAFADAISKRKLMQQGKIPYNFIAKTTCTSCGDVYVPPELVNNGNVLGCPWCWNRACNFPIPSFGATI